MKGQQRSRAVKGRNMWTRSFPSIVLLQNGQSLGERNAIFFNATFITCRLTHRDQIWTKVGFCTTRPHGYRSGVATCRPVHIRCIHNMHIFCRASFCNRCRDTFDQSSLNFSVVVDAYEQKYSANYSMVIKTGLRQVHNCQSLKRENSAWTGQDGWRGEALGAWTIPFTCSVYIFK